MSGRKFRENTLKRRAFFDWGIVALPAPIKAHTAPYVRTQAGLIGGVPLCHEFFNALLLSRNVHSLKLLLIKLLHDELYWPNCMEQTFGAESSCMEQQFLLIVAGVNSP